MEEKMDPLFLLLIIVSIVIGITAALLRPKWPGVAEVLWPAGVTVAASAMIWTKNVGKYELCGCIGIMFFYLLVLLWPKPRVEPNKPSKAP